MPNSNTSYVKFQDCWLKDSAFKPWLKRSGASNNEAECIICKKLVDFKSMGRSALVSHMKGKKHISLTAASKTTDASMMRGFLSKRSDELKSGTSTQTQQSSSVPPTQQSPSVLPCSSMSSSMNSFLSDKTVLKSEIWWSIRTALKNYSSSSNSEIRLLLQKNASWCTNS